MQKEDRSQKQWLRKSMEVDGSRRDGVYFRKLSERAQDCNNI
jgi:hypothetical protein